MKLKTFAAVVGAASVTALSIAVPAIAVSDAPSVEDILPILTTPASSDDRVSAAVDLTKLGDIAPETVRSLGNDDLASYWIGRSGDTLVCLIAYIPDGYEVAGSACIAIPDFYRSGLGLVLGEGDSLRTTEAYLFPADIDPLSLGIPLEAQSGVNFVSARPGTFYFEQAVVERTDGSTFQFNPLTIQAKQDR